MSDSLSARQTQLLKCIIDEYIKTALPVGSEALEKKYSLGVSPATIRSEMSDLVGKGYLKQLHASAGRAPTPKGMKFYIDQLMEEKKMSVSEEVKAKEEVMKGRKEIGRMMSEATHALAETTGNLAIGSDSKGNLWHAGYKNIFLQPEFADLGMSMNILSFIEEARRMHELFFERMTGMTPIEVLFGEELGWSDLDYIGVVGTRFKLGNEECALGVVGPQRLEFGRLIPVLRYFRSIMQEAGGY